MNDDEEEEEDDVYHDDLVNNATTITVVGTLRNLPVLWCNLLLIHGRQGNYL